MRTFHKRSQPFTSLLPPSPPEVLPRRPCIGAGITKDPVLPLPLSAESRLTTQEGPLLTGLLSEP